MTENLKEKSRERLALWILGGMLLALLAATLLWRSALAPQSAATPAPSSEPNGETTDMSQPYKIVVSLSEVKVKKGAETLPRAQAIPLSEEESAALFSRLPNLPPEAGQTVEFNRPAESLPPPQPGNKIREAFPPSPLDSAPPVEIPAGPLQVTRFAPQGEVSVAPFVSVTFNQPMVPLGTLAQLAQEDVPVRIEPPLQGTWRWLGTKTLTFEYDSALIDRLPKATQYRVTVPAGIQSMSGNALTETVTWTFATPPPKVVQFYPSDSPQPLNPPLFILFDQRIEPAAMLKTIKMRADGADVNLVLASQEEIEKDEIARGLTKNAPQGRWLAFRAASPLPADSRIVVTVGPGSPSAEGPLLTAEAQSFSFSTYAPFKVENFNCGWSEDCPPFSPFYVAFNNPLDLNSFDERLIQIEPKIPGVSIYAYGNTLSIEGQTQGRTTYSVTLSGSLRDVFGQTLGQDVKLRFKVGAADSLLVNPGQNFLTLDPSAAKPVFTFYAVNHSQVHLRAYIVQPNDWEAYQAYLLEWRRTDSPPSLPGILAEDTNLALNLPPDTLAPIEVELSEYLKNNLGHVVLVIEPPAGLFESEEEKWKRFSQTIVVWIQSTQIGLDAFNDHSEMYVWATDLKSGAPLPGVEILSSAGGAAQRTGADGVARFAIPDGAAYLVARRGADVALLPHTMRGMYPWSKRSPGDSLRWFVFDDRAMYQPGEKVHLKGWIRLAGETQTGDVTLAGGGIDSVRYTLSDSQGNKLAEGIAPVNALGGFDFALTLPKNANLGPATFALSAGGAYSGLHGAQFPHSIRIEEFRRPEFEVSARSDTVGPYFAGGGAVLSVQAGYYAGGGLPNADANWTINVSPSHYAPPNWDDFIFGSWRPWWIAREFDFSDGQDTYTFAGKTDENGTHSLKIDFKAQGDAANDPQPFSVSAYANVTDVNRQTWGAGTSLLVHPADVYVGLRSESYFVARGTPLKVDFIVADLDGNPVSGRETLVSAGRMEWKYRQGEWREEIADVQHCNMTSSGEPQTCVFETPVGGSYQITALVRDEQGRANQTRIIRWVSGGGLPPARQVEQEQAILIPDKESYQPGDTAKILVQAPFVPAEGILTVSRSGILYATRFKMTEATTTLSVPIEDEHIPNLNIQVDLVGAAPRENDAGEPMTDVPPRPAYAKGELILSIPPLQRALTLEVQPEETSLQPGGETTLYLRASDARGLPVAGAELAVVAVDEAILALTDYQMGDPLDVFYQYRYSMLESLYGRGSIVLADPQALTKAANQPLSLMEAPAMAAPMATQAAPSADARGESSRPPVNARVNFNPLAVFSPSVRTDLNGEARIQIKLPDNLTRYRIMVVAADSSGKKFGKGEANLTARLPLMARPSAPRFLNFGDKFELPVVIQNQTDSEMLVNVAVRAANLQIGLSGQQATVPANDRVEVRFPASALRAGEAYIQVIAASAHYADAAEISLPVYAPATSEAFATYGVLDEEGALAQPVLRPEGVIPQYGGLQISASSTALQSLTDAALYLVEYPYECSEQLASRVLAVAALRDVLGAFKAEGLPSQAELQAAVSRDVERLKGLQNYDGGFPYWRRGFDSVPFNTIHVAHALIRAQEKGYAVPPETLANALNYLREIENHYPDDYGERTKQTLSAYALYVRSLGGERDSQKASRLLEEAGLENLSMEAIGWLWQVIDDPSQREAIRVFVKNRAVETAGAANFTTAYDDQTYLLLSSDRRTDAILLDALMSDDPQSDLIPKLVNGLLAHRQKGRWLNTQENVFALLALDRYFRTYESQTPDFAARFWLGETYAGESEFRGYNADTRETFLPMSYVLDETAAGAGDLILGKEGAGRLYYRLALQYAPANLNLDPLEMGFSVQRTYEALDDPADVTRDANGVWHIKAGARVKVKIQMVADNRRYHVALADPLPAGLEIINPALAVSEALPIDSPAPYDWMRRWTWFEHQNLRSDRAEAFASLLWEGVYEYSYYARATTPGVFIAPPAKAEEMYAPETFGRSGSDWVIVE